MGNSASTKDDRSERKSSKAKRKKAWKALTWFTSSSGAGDGNKRPQPEHSHPPASDNFTEKFLTEEEIAHVKDSWTYLKRHNETILMEAFISMFQDNPDLKEKFYDFKEYTIEDLKKPEQQLDSNSALKRHLQRVSRAMCKVVARVDDMDSMVEYLQVLGKLHHRHGIQNGEMTLIAPYYVASSVKFLPKAYKDRSVQDSWLKLFAVIMDLMKRGYPDVELSLSSRDKTLIQDTWTALQNEGFLSLLNSYSSSKLFAAQSRDSTRLSASLMDALQNHGTKIIKVVEKVVQNPEDDGVSQELARIGRAHQELGIHPQYLDVMGPIFCQALGPVLDEDGQWDKEIRLAWLCCFRIISNKMKMGYVDDDCDGAPRQEDEKPGHDASTSISVFEEWTRGTNGEASASAF